MSVRRAQDEIDSREFTEWIAYHRLEPFGPQVEDLRQSAVCATIANVNRRKGAKPLAASAFLLFPPQKGEGNNTGAEIALIAAFAASRGLAGPRSGKK